MYLKWTSLTVGEWREMLKSVPRSNCMQTWPYAKAVRMSDQKGTRVAEIIHQEKAVGMVAVQEVKLGPIHFVNLYRGPLWYHELVPDKWMQEFTKAFDKEFPRRLLRRRRWLPEWEQPDASLFSPFRPNKQNYKTAWLELASSELELRSQLKQKWRNALNKSEKSPLEIVEDWTGIHLELFVQEYLKDRLEKKYHGPSGRFVKEEFLAAKPFKDGLLLWAQLHSQPVAAIFVLKHGVCASYRIGWSTQAGRKFNAHNRLLWEAVLILKSQGIERLDLGGLDSELEESGLNRFKTGTGARITESPGMLR